MKHILALFLALFGSMVALSAHADSEVAIPHYTTVTTDPADGATVRSVTTIAVTLSHDDLDDPLGIMPGAAMPTATHTADGTTTAITGLKAAVKGGQLIVTFPEPLTAAGDVTIDIPAGLTNNLAMPVAMMTPEEIVEEGGCTNPHITLTLHIAPQYLPVRDVTGIGYNTTWLMDEDGNYIKNEKGQYVRIDQYSSLIDAKIKPGRLDDDNVINRVSVIYFWYDEEFATIDYKGGASVRNITNGTPMAISSVTFKQGGDNYRNNVIELRLSTTAYIYSSEYHQGVYEVTLPSGIATTADGAKSDGITFRFTFGNPDKAYFADAVDLTEFLGDYKVVVGAGEKSTGEYFTLSQSRGKCYVEKLLGTSLILPLETEGSLFFLRATENADGESFRAYRGGDVEVSFEQDGGNFYMMVGDYVLINRKGERITGGGSSFRLVASKPTGISALMIDALGDEKTKNERFATKDEGTKDEKTQDGGRKPHDLLGRPVKAGSKGIIVDHGRAVIR